jgi:hypothetical protein
MESYLYSCRYLSLIDYHKHSLVSSNVSAPKGFDMKNRPKPRIRPLITIWNVALRRDFGKMAGKESSGKGDMNDTTTHYWDAYSIVEDYKLK